MVCGLLIAVTSAVEHRFQSSGSAVVHGLSCFCLFVFVLTCGLQDLVPRPWIETVPPTLGVWSPNH